MVKSLKQNNHKLRHIASGSHLAEEKDGETLVPELCAEVPESTAVSPEKFGGKHRNRPHPLDTRVSELTNYVVLLSVIL